MANVIRTTKRIVNPISGIVEEVQIEIDSAREENIQRFQVANRLTVLNTVGTKAHTSREQICNLKGNTSRTAWRKRLAEKSQRELTTQGV